MQMKTLEARQMLGLLTDMGAERTIRPAKFSYACAINRRSLMKVEETFADAMKGPHDDVLAKFEEKRREIMLKHGQQDANGNVILNGAGLPTSFNQVAAESDWADLCTAHPELKEAAEAQAKRAAELQDVPVDVDIHKVSIDLFPEFPIAIMEILLPMVAA